MQHYNQLTILFLQLFIAIYNENAIFTTSHGWGLLLFATTAHQLKELPRGARRETTSVFPPCTRFSMEG